MLDQTSLTARLDKLLKDNNVAGMSVAVTDKEKIVYKKGFGVESVERPQNLTTPDTIYRIASVTKLVTGMTVLSLVEDGILDLDKPVKEYLPWLTLSNPKAEEQMTLRHLLSHTSGLPRTRKITEGSRDEDTIEEALKRELPKCEMATLPEDETFQYSNIGLSLAGQVAASVTGKMYSTIAKEKIFTPLGMDKTTFDLHEALTYPFSLGHKEDENGKLWVIHYLRMNTLFRASGGLYSNVIDLSKLLRCMLNGGRSDSGEHVLNSEHIELMHTLKSKRQDSDDFYGLTTHMHKYKDRFLYGHNGQSTPYSTSVYIDKKTGYGIVTLMNTDRANLRTDIPDMILDMIEE